MKSSYPFGILLPKFGVMSYLSNIEKLIRHYDVTLICAPFAKCGKIQMPSSRERFANTNK